MKKLEYKEWPHRPFEKFYIEPLLRSFNILRSNLVKLYSMGFEFWKLPLGKNTVFLKNVVELVNRENIAESILGNPLLRAQMMFFYNVFKIIVKTNVVNTLLFERDEKFICSYLTKFIVFKALLHFNKVIDSKMKIFNFEKKESNNLYQNIKEQRIGFHLLSAKEKRFEIPLSKCID